MAPRPEELHMRGASLWLDCQDGSERRMEMVEESQGVFGRMKNRIRGRLYNPLQYLSLQYQISSTMLSFGYSAHSDTPRLGRLHVAALGSGAPLILQDLLYWECGSADARHSRLSRCRSEPPAGVDGADLALRAVAFNAAD